jgi:serine/threonine-protein kinase
MKGKGPLFTLIGGLVLAALVVALSSVAVKRDTARQNAANDTAAPAPAQQTTAATPSAAPSETARAKPAAEPPGTYAGKVEGGAATLAIAVKDGQAIAYLCNGRNIESWLQGSASGGQLTLTGLKEGSLTGTYGNGRAAGTVSSGGKQYTFKIGVVSPPSGLYRLSTMVAGAKLSGGWIRIPPNDEQVGMVYIGDSAQGAPPINSNGEVVINGTTQRPGQIDGGTPLN